MSESGEKTKEANRDAITSGVMRAVLHGLGERGRVEDNLETVGTSIAEYLANLGSERVFEAFVDDPDPKMRLAIAENHWAPFYIRYALIKDQDASVSQMARASIEKDLEEGGITLEDIEAAFERTKRTE